MACEDERKRYNEELESYKLTEQALQKEGDHLDIAEATVDLYRQLHRECLEKWKEHRDSPKLFMCWDVTAPKLEEWKQIFDDTWDKIDALEAALDSLDITIQNYCDALYDCLAKNP